MHICCNFSFFFTFSTCLPSSLLGPSSSSSSYWPLVRTHAAVRSTGDMVTDSTGDCTLWTHAKKALFGFKHVWIKQTLFPHLCLYLFGPSCSWNRTVSGARGLLSGSLTALLHGFSVDAAAATQGSAVRKRSWSSRPCISCHQPRSSTLLLHLHDMCRTCAALPRYRHNLGSQVLVCQGRVPACCGRRRFLSLDAFAAEFFLHAAGGGHLCSGSSSPAT